MFVVVGSSMNAGKTTTAAHLIRGMARDGFKTGAMKVTLNQTERGILEAKQTTDLEAYIAFAEAERSLFFPKLTTALPLLERAIALDPSFIDAEVAYAEANFQIWSKSYNTTRFAPARKSLASFFSSEARASTKTSGRRLLAVMVINTLLASELTAVTIPLAAIIPACISASSVVASMSM